MFRIPKGLQSADSFLPETGIRTPVASLDGLALAPLYDARNTCLHIITANIEEGRERSPVVLNWEGK